MTTTAADWVNEAQQKVTAGSRDERNKLLTAMTDTTGTTVPLAYDLGAVQAGSEIAVDLEEMYVWAVDTTAKTATVERGINGSSAATHLINTTVYVNPKHSKFAIFRAINQEIMSLAPAGMFDMAQVELTYNPSKVGYDLTGVTSIQDIYKVEAKFTGLTGDWRLLADHEFELGREENTTDFPTGFMLRIRRGGQSGQSVRVHYKQPFVALTDLSTDVATTLLPASAYEIPPLGAAARLVGPREVGRNDTSSQGDTRRASEVPPGAVAAAALRLRQECDRLIGLQVLELQRRYPVLTSMWAS